MAASEDKFILGTKAAADVYSFWKFLHIFYISYFDVMLKRKDFYDFFSVKVLAKSVSKQN